MFLKKFNHFVSPLLTAGFTLALLLTACTPAASTGTQPTLDLPTVAVVEPTDVPVVNNSPVLTLDSSRTAAEITIDMVAAVMADSGAPYWEVLPEYTRVTLEGYPISGHLMQPQIFIYPVEELESANEGAAGIVDSLQSLLDAPQEIENMPFLPLFNAGQMMHTQVQYLDFQNGRGVRYLTMFSQGLVPVNNHELIYTYQGLTNDGRYYVAAILPVQHANLPVDGAITGNEPAEFASDFQTYVASVAASLNTQASDSFSPDLTVLDALMASIAVD